MGQRMLMSGERHTHTIGGYRTHGDPMQVVSNKLHEPEVYFEAPSSSKMDAEMDAFMAWFNETAPGGKRALPTLTRAGIAHLYFVSIHPFEDGNGRIGRALAEKSLAQNLGQIRSSERAKPTTQSSTAAAGIWRSPAGSCGSPRRFSKRNARRSGASISILPRRGSMRSCAAR
jgi:Fic family protein